VTTKTYRLGIVGLGRTGSTIDPEAIRLLRRPVPVVAFVNNHFAGFAPETVRQLVALTDPLRCGLEAIPRGRALIRLRGE
jgi:hypothetical protein